ncbi:CPXCG motif-containing cysteine-rich protein [Flavobacteriaceae bacterium LMO-SS05]
MEEHFFQCPYCWEEISMLVDYSQKHQNYIEDCEVCCNPIQLVISIENNVITSFQIKKAQ